MKFIFIIALAATTFGMADASDSRDDDAQRLVTILDYIGADYAGAVSAPGQIANKTEFDEQRAFIQSARLLTTHLAGGAGDPLAAQVAAIAPLIDAAGDPAEVSRRCREARDEAVKRFGLATAPGRRPSLPRARALFAESCEKCHGPRGDGDTALGRSLSPPPADYRDRKRLAALSPFRAYNTLTFGVPGTAMPSFEALSPAERWDLAFYVFYLGHAGEPAVGGAFVPVSDLARSSDDDLRARLRKAGADDVEATIAFLRRDAPFVEPPPQDGLAVARSHLAEAAAAQREGRTLDAQRSLIDAYLLGFEPLEPKLAARDPRSVTDVEKAFGDLRSALSASVAPDAFERKVADLERRMIDATEGKRPAMAPFFAAGLVFFREGLEAALLVAALLAGVRRLNRPEATKFIHLGWVAALPAGVATWWAFDRIVRLGADKRELVEAAVSIVAAGVLFSVSFWMISKAESRHWMAYLRKNLERTLTRRSLYLVAGLAFLAVYREAAETVLFLQALVLEAGAARAEVYKGVGAALVAVFACAYAMNRTIARLPLGPFFAVSSLFLCLLAVSFAGSGIHTLVASGYLPARPVRFPEVPWLGIHPDLTSLLVQLAIASTIAIGAVVTLRRRPTTG